MFGHMLTDCVLVSCLRWLSHWICKLFLNPLICSSNGGRKEGREGRGIGIGLIDIGSPRRT